ncbi:two-component regulator propeller domain-containing protein [Rubricoccus marinus]|uniref:histidine kinase n=1 Tax=Rubricoccus marinus TaxID=716817 RepID=A0A259U1X7_9BACT|nr:two-component regulator propeller domain-containing protein [Rubricoccus marinus]OZC03940.1 hypothetical protein BSZ36_13690 [Rubricoccus marinus]
MRTSHHRTSHWLAAAAVLLCCGLALAGPGWLAAQNAASGASAGEPPEAERVAFRHLTTSDGLANESVATVLQDRFGFIWIGTADGLNRYDGYQLIEYKRGPDSTSLSDNVVSALAEDARGSLWVGTRRGLSRLDRETERFQRFRAGRGSIPNDDVIALLADSSGAVWAGTGGGLGRYDLETEAWTTFRHAPGDASTLPNDNVSALALGSDGALWVGTDDGVSRLDMETGTFRAYRPPGTSDGFSGAVSSISVSEEGHLWVGTLGNGLYRLDPASGAFEPAAIAGLSVSVVSSVYEDGGGTLWVGTFGDGLRQIPPGATEAIEYQATEGDPDALIDEAVSDIYEDRQGVLWVATYGGLDRFDRARGTVARFRHDPQEPTSLSSNDVAALLTTRDGTLYVGTDRAIDVTTDRSSFRHTPVSGTSGPAATLALLEAEDGTIWAGTEAGIFRVSASGAEPVALPGRAIIAKALLEDRDGSLFVGTLGEGLIQRDPASGGTVSYTHDPADPGSIAHDHVRALAEDARGALWAGTEEGLCRLDEAGANARFTCFRAAPEDPDALADGYIHTLHAREDGTLWIGTKGGLHKLDTSAPERGFSRLTEAETDLPSDDVLAIVEDDDNYLWLATSRGLTRFDPVTDTFQQRTLGGEGSARTLGEAATRTASGELLFGGSNGLLAFFPTQLAASNPNPPEVVITAVSLGGEPLAPGPDSPLDAPAPLAERLKLDHAQANYVTFAFAGLHFSDPGRNSYRFTMEGFDEDWRGGLGARERTAPYTNIPPGKYTFRVQAANADGVWNETGASLDVVVTPPWWRTPWAYLAYAGLLVFGFVRFDKWQRQRLLKEERERAERREQEIRAETAEAEAQQAEADRQRAEAEARAARAEADRQRTEAEGKREIEKAFRELKAMQTQLVQSEKLASLGQLTAGIAHEIKNPLNFVNNFADLSVELADELGEELRDNKDKPVSAVLEEVTAILDDLRENSRRIHEHGTRADRIVKAMLLHSRGSSAERGQIVANAFVEEYANLAYHGARANDKEFQVDLVRDLDPNAGEVEVIPQELGRVLINLLSNAFYAVGQRKRTDGEGYEPRVTVATTRETDPEQDWVEIRIEDNGTGIPDEIREKVFEPFFTTKPTGDGTGLGLSLAYDIITQGHGGTLAVESEENVGTTFIIRLPAKSAPEAVTA